MCDFIISCCLLYDFILPHLFSYHKAAALNTTSLDGDNDKATSPSATITIVPPVHLLSPPCRHQYGLTATMTMPPSSSSSSLIGCSGEGWWYDDDDAIGCNKGRQRMPPSATMMNELPMPLPSRMRRRQRQWGWWRPLLSSSSCLRHLSHKSWELPELPYNYSRMEELVL